MKENFTFLANKIKKDCPKAKTLVDVGCAEGDFILHAKKVIPRLKVTGLDLPKHDITRLSTLPQKTFDVVTMIGVHSEFDSVKEWLKNLLFLGSDKSTYFVMGYFNPYPIDIVTEWKESWEDRFHRNGYNIPSQATVNAELMRLGRNGDFSEFTISTDIKKTDFKRVWTFKDEYGKRYQTNGVCQLIPFSLLTIYPNA